MDSPQQIRRVAVSVVANIAAGKARHGARQYHAFLQIAYGSLRECEAIILLATRLEFLDTRQADELQHRLAHTSRQLLGLIRSHRRAL
jgi:four helix bundle protein